MSAIIEEFLSVGVYKRSQGRVVRQVTFAALAVTLLIGLWKLVLFLRGYGDACPAWLCYAVPSLVGAAGLWIAYRVVNFPTFADFLIAVEAEMNKVSWPTKSELFRWSVVVIIMIFSIGMLLAVYDFIWIWIFSHIGVFS